MNGAGTAIDDLTIKAILTILDVGSGVDVIRVLTALVEFARLRAELSAQNPVYADISAQNRLSANISIINELEGDIS